MIKEYYSKWDSNINSPHTYGVRYCPCGPIATNPCRPTACISLTLSPSDHGSSTELLPLTGPLKETPNSKLLTPNSFYATPPPSPSFIFHFQFFNSSHNPHITVHNTKTTSFHVIGEILYLCTFLITINMKKIIVIAALFLGTIAIFAACDTQHKCAAYGHYACYEAPADIEE